MFQIKIFRKEYDEIKIFKIKRKDLQKLKDQKIEKIKMKDHNWLRILKSLIFEPSYPSQTHLVLEMLTHLKITLLEKPCRKVFDSFSWTLK